MVNATVHMAGDSDETPLPIQDFQQSSNWRTAGIGASAGARGLRQFEGVSVPHAHFLASANHKFRKFRQESFEGHKAVFYPLFLGRYSEPVKRNSLAFLELCHARTPQTCQERTTANLLAQIVGQ